VLLGAELREHDQVAGTGFGGQVGETLLLLLRLFGGRRDEICPFGAVERRRDGRRFIEVRDDDFNTSRQSAAVSLRPHRGSDPRTPLDQCIHDGPPRVPGRAGDQDRATAARL
jgi:hypothetical protein